MLTEAQKNCPYCHEYGGYKPVLDDGWITFDYFDSRFHIRTDYGAYTLLFNYCPVCGRPLSEEEEK
ncbi:MAG: hypothetical protein ACLSH6_01310 [Limosilactobacillus pontis]